MNHKLIFFDIDGTLKPVAKDIPSSTRQAIQKLKDNGHIPVICTGRALSAVTHDETLMSLDCTGIICAAGNQVVLNGETIYRHNLDHNTIHEITDILRDCKTPYMLEGEHALYYESQFKSDCMEAWGAVLGDVPMKEYKDDCDYIQKCTAINARWIQEANRVHDLEKKMDLLWYEGPGNIVEMLPKNTSKATGIQVLMKHFDLPLSATYAFGDGPNDMEMIDFVSHGIAMENAVPELKDRADYVTGMCDEDGIFDALVHYSLL